MLVSGRNLSSMQAVVHSKNKAVKGQVGTFICSSCLAGAIQFRKYHTYSLMCVPCSRMYVLKATKPHPICQVSTARPLSWLGSLCCFFSSPSKVPAPPSTLPFFVFHAVHAVVSYRSAKFQGEEE
jgi:hypothetical protein